jgi:hypothetical protein
MDMKLKHLSEAVEEFINNPQSQTAYDYAKKLLELANPSAKLTSFRSGGIIPGLVGGPRSDPEHQYPN